MPHRSPLMRVLERARDATMPSYEGFLRAFNAIPAYQQSYVHDMPRQESFSLVNDGVLLAFRYVRSTGSYIVNFCSKALDVFED